jgi:hypothetical protein
LTALRQFCFPVNIGWFELHGEGLEKRIMVTEQLPLFISGISEIQVENIIGAAGNNPVCHLLFSPYMELYLPMVGIRDFNEM